MGNPRRLLSLGIITSIVLPQLALCYGLPNIEAHYGNKPAKFQLQVDPGFVQDTRRRVVDTRVPVNLNDQPVDGPNFDIFDQVREFWIHKYDWESTQEWINKKFNQFTTTVKVNTTSFDDLVPLHFVHHRSKRTDAIPLLFIHGWPGSFLEVGRIIDVLTNPPNASLPAFHVVAPSIPGFGFSPAPVRSGFGPREAGHAFNSLMIELNYNRYVINGGDFGSFILRYQAASYPYNVVSTLSNFWTIEPNSTDLTRYALNETTVDESYYITLLNTFKAQFSGYRYIQETLPLTAAFPLTDSPLGFAMWIFSLMDNAIDHTNFKWTPQEIITWAFMYLIQGPYGGLRFYKEALREREFAGFGFGESPFVHQPTAISQFPYDVWYREPLDWAQREGNVKIRYIHTTGGHFAAYEVPELLAGDLWKWFSNGKLSGTEVFWNLS